MEILVSYIPLLLKNETFFREKFSDKSKMHMKYDSYLKFAAKRAPQGGQGVSFTMYSQNQGRRDSESTFIQKRR